jgi:hypothetical protein
MLMTLMLDAKAACLEEKQSSYVVFSVVADCFEGPT